VPHYVIDIHSYTHTCPGSGRHVFDTRRTIVATEPGGRCTRPVTITLAGRSVVVSCARAVPAPQHCPACRVTITIRHRHTTHLGPVASHTQPIAVAA
jgi:hypothetical protein